jgi:hypothetical protein
VGHFFARTSCGVSSASTCFKRFHLRFRFFQLQEFYADIKAGPRKLPKPKALKGPAAAGAGDASAQNPATPEGLQSLVEAISYFNKSHVQFVAVAHADLSQRANQLVAEVSKKGGGEYIYPVVHHTGRTALH